MKKNILSIFCCLSLLTLASCSDDYNDASTKHVYGGNATWKGNQISNERYQPDSQQKTGALLRFPSSANTIQLKVGISFISSLKARENVWKCRSLLNFKIGESPKATYWFARNASLNTISLWGVGVNAGACNTLAV